MIKWVKNIIPDGASVRDDIMSVENVERARAFHRTFRQYEETPLTALNARAEKLRLGGLWVKDESSRFGLNAFKVLGCSYAMGCLMADRMGIERQDASYDVLKAAAKSGDATFYTATDGNHGRAVAWTARELSQKARVFMPEGTSRERFDNVRAEGAEVTVEPFNYDRCVEKAERECRRDMKGVLVQDTAWEGYEEIPALIMQGYGTMAAEAAEQLGSLPTHIFLQAGVGSMAAAVTGYFANLDTPPVITVVEPNAAECLYRSAVAGKREAVDGELDTIMAGLACGEVSTLAWEILRAHADFFVSVPDSIAAEGMRLLAKPYDGDGTVVSGESGAVCVGLVEELMTDESLSELRRELGLDQNSRVLCFSTEGATDRKRWEEIVFNGAFT